ncbi:MAG TPA: tetratricopeptide repeat protein, partial [Humisphaera sp.]|nr:tetratricopeptide repeat protein [Humisphaera sp.]
MPFSLAELLDHVIAVCGGDADEAIGRGDSLFSQGQFQKSLIHFLAAKKLRPTADCEYRIGLGYWRIGDLASARTAFEEAVRINPLLPEAHCELGRLCLAMGNVELAMKHSRRAVEIAPDNPDFAVALASALEADGQSESAVAIVDRLAAAGYASVDLALVYSRLAPRFQREELALELIARLERGSVASAQQSALDFAAGNLLDRLGRYDEAFARARDANALRQSHYDPVHVEESIAQWIECFDRAAVARLPHASNQSDVPVFIVGMPRSGTSLVEQILASHPLVHGAGELNWIADLSEDAIRGASMGKPPELQALWNLSVEDLN